MRSKSIDANDEFSFTNNPPAVTKESRLIASEQMHARIELKRYFKDNELDRRILFWLHWFRSQKKDIIDYDFLEYAQVDDESCQVKMFLGWQKRR